MPEGDQTLSKKENITLKDIEQRKKKIEAELDQIQSRYRDGTTDSLKRSVFSRINPAGKIRKNPLTAVSLAIAAGFFAGMSQKKKSREKKDRERHSENGSVRVSNLVFNELKRIVAKRAVNYFVDRVDTALTELQKPAPPPPPPGENSTI